MPQHPTGGRRAPHLRVRYYPRRLDRSAPRPSTPSQALHLPTDPARAERAASTSQALDLAPVAATPARRTVLPPPAPTARGRLRRWLRALLPRGG